MLSINMYDKKQGHTALFCSMSLFLSGIDFTVRFYA